MTKPVVVQSRDRTGRTTITWYPDEGAACAGDDLAHVASGSLHIGGDTPRDVADLAIGLYRNELVQDPWADLSWVTTHHQTEPGGPFEPNERTTSSCDGEPTCAAHVHRLSCLGLYVTEQEATNGLPAVEVLARRRDNELNLRAVARADQSRFPTAQGGA